MSAPLDIRILENLSPPDWWTIGLTGAATILGAVIGAVIAYVIARQTAKESKEMAGTARRDVEEAATLRAEVKVMELANAVAGYHHQTERIIEEATKKIGETALWNVMAPIAGKPKEIEIDADDLIAFTRAREFDYVTQLLFACSRYNSMIYSVEIYRIRRDELLAMITPNSMDGLIGSIAIGEEQFRKLAPHIAMVDNLAKQVRADMKEVYDLVLKTLDDFGPIVKKYFNDPKFPVPGRAAAAGNPQVTP